MWKADVVDKRLENYKSVALTAEPGSDIQKQNLIRYQELKFICEDIFRWYKIAEDKARKKVEENK